VRETKRLFETEFDHCFFSFSPFSFFAVVADEVLCCDQVPYFREVFILGGRKNKRRKWKVQKLQRCSCGGVYFFGFGFEVADRLAIVLFRILCRFLCCVARILLLPPHGVLETYS
jgi:hypothetical protein